MLSTGALICDRFELRKLLGAGGLAEVWAARDRVTQEDVALKLLHEHLCGDPLLRERFRRELAAARSVAHANVVRVFELHEHAGRPLFSMELLAGEILSERLLRAPPEKEEALRIAKDALRGLRVAHQAGVVHRDLKPANIFLCDDGVVKLLDFGLARVAGWARLTAQSTLLGTPGFIAPELLNGQGADARADLYAIGAVLFELLTHRAAFPMGDVAETLLRKRGAAPSPREVDAAISEEHDAIVRRALEPDPEKRFLDAAQMLNALEGTAAAPAPPAPVALTAGTYDVIVQGGVRADTESIGDVLEALGARDVGSGWHTRLRLAGEAVLVSGANRASAESVSALCEERGLSCTLEPKQTLAPWRAVAARGALAIGGAAGAVSGAVAWAVFSASASVAAGVGGLGAAAVPLAVLLPVGVAATLGTAAWALAGMGESPPRRELPSGDPAVRRLMEGIARRVLRLKRRAAEAPEGKGALLVHLADGAERLAEAAAPIAEAAAGLPDPLAVDSSLTPPAGTAARRDRAVAKLLEIAASLDEVTAALDRRELPDVTKLIESLRKQATDTNAHWAALSREMSALNQEK